jgi:cytochrome c biogenesis protein CcmG/thiol:disulfide interchange protein DsbE
MNPRRRILLQCLAAFVALVALPTHARELKVGATAPAATLITLDGKSISTESLRGQTIILTFWATWCEPCREELPLLSRYAKDHRDQGLRVLGFSLDDADRVAKVQGVADTLSFPVGLLERSRAAGYGRMWRVPVSFVIDRDGVLRYDGWQAKQPVWTESSLNSVVNPLLVK